MQEKLNKNSELAVFDVTNLWTNMPHKLGLKAIEYWLDKYPELTHSRLTNL